MSVQADYLAYAVVAKSKVPLPASIDPIETEYLLNPEWGEYNGAKSRLGVLGVDNNSSSSSYTSTGSDGSSYNWSSDNADTVPVNAIEAIVVDVLNRSGRFRLVERNVLGAQFLVQVVVTDYEAKTKGTGGGLAALVASRVPVLGGVGFEKGEGRVGMNFRLINAETSEIIYTKQIESVIKESGLTFGGEGFSSAGALGGFLGNFSKTPIGRYRRHQQRHLRTGQADRCRTGQRQCHQD